MGKDGSCQSTHQKMLNVGNGESSEWRAEKLGFDLADLRQERDNMCSKIVRVVGAGVS